MEHKPNFIIFLTDDQGYGDLSCMAQPGSGTDFRTPHLDRLARQGVRFTSWYSNSPVCSPSRAALLTGRYPGNAGVRAILAGHRTATGLPVTVPTLAKALKGLGYNTYLSGKWHLGVSPASRPHHHGFDHWTGFLAGCIDYYSHIFYWGMAQKLGSQNLGAQNLGNPTHDLWQDDLEIWRNGEYFTHTITRQAVAYLRHAHAEGKPFFLYVPYNAPHYPMHAPEEYMQRFSHLPWDRQIMAAMLSAVDDGVGEIMAEVERLGMEQDTVTFFTSDNGPSRESRNWLDGTQDPYYGGSAGKLKGHKFSLYEGGIRMPAILHAPGQVPEGKVLDSACASMDIFPTFLNMVGGDPAEYELDGIDLSGYISQGLPLPDRHLYWEMNGQTAVRRGRWKLVLDGQLVEGAPVEDDVHLSDMDQDMGERINLKDRYPDITAELSLAAQDWRQALETRWQREFMPAGS